jgi:predicted AAA+ superfamily ATPase
VFVDEIQKVPQLLDEVHALIEETGARFILTGSSAHKLRRHGTNLLGGRASVRHLHPLTLEELGDEFSLDDVLRFGSLPAVVTADDDTKVEILTAYAQTYLREEIQAESLIRNLGGFGRLLDLVASESGSIVNFSALGREAGVATRTVQEYFQVLEDTLILQRLEPYWKSARARMVSHPRFYLFDTGVTNGLNRTLTAAPDPQRRGRLFEQWVVLESFRTLDYLQSEARLFFWRTHNGAEVDLLVEKHGKLVLAAEIKSGRRVAGADLTGLASFLEVHPKTRAVVVGTVPEAYEVHNIPVLPCAQFFELLREIA